MVMTGLVVETNNLLTDNPELYDLMFPDPDFETARFVDALLRRYGAGSRVLDVGCGLGREVGYLSERGYTAVGLDCSPRMLAFAREHYTLPRFVLGRMEAFSLGEQFDVVTCLDSAFLSNHTNEAVEASLRCFHRHLAPGGLLLLEMRNGAHLLGNSTLFAGEQQSEIIRGRQRIQSSARYWIDHRAQLLCRRRTWSLPERTEPLVQETAWRLLFPQELRSYLERNGFLVCAMFDGPGPHAEHPWDPGEMAMIQMLSGRRLHVIARAIDHPGRKD